MINEIKFKKNNNNFFFTLYFTGVKDSSNKILQTVQKFLIITQKTA